MTTNQDTQAAQRFHQGTKHPRGALLDPYHRYNPRQRPLLFKKYQDVDRVELEVETGAPGMPALQAIALSGVSGDGKRVPDVDQIAALLFLSAGITKRIHYQGYGDMYFRAASCTGALYHIELYLVCADLPGLDAGVYHFDPSSMALDLLREGDYRPAVAEATGGQEQIAHAPAVLVASDVYYRNACKYQARAYRHAYWDSGTLLSHSLSVAGSLDLPHRLVMGFEDQAMNRVLDLDEDQEYSLALLSLGWDPEPVSAQDLPLPSLDLETEPIADEVQIFPEILKIHRASCLPSGEAARSWRRASLDPAKQGLQGELIPLDPLPASKVPQDGLGAVIRRRGSSRQFSRQPISFQALSTLLRSSTAGIPTDFEDQDGLPQNRVYLIVHAVEGLEQGAYVYHEEEQALEVLARGSFRDQSRQLALGQDLGGDAAVAIYFLSDLKRVLDSYGNRGYRTAHLEASIAAGKMYLAAYAQSLGATGLTFNDDQVTEFFSPHAAGKAVMFLIAVGVPG